MWNACDGLGSYGKIVKLLLLTGTRREEIGHLRWDETNLPERMLILPPSRTKTDTPHLVPLSEPAMAILKSVKKNDSEIVFPTVTGLRITNWVSSSGGSTTSLAKQSGRFGYMICAEPAAPGYQN